MQQASGASLSNVNMTALQTDITQSPPGRQTRLVVTMLRLTTLTATTFRPARDLPRETAINLL